MADIDSALNAICEKFKLEALNPHQKRALVAFKDEGKDLFINLPTGFGKSLIYQALPLLYDELTGVSGHIVLVISPLVNLIQDQVETLRSLGIAAISLRELGDKDEEGVEGKMNAVEDGRFAVVYSTPEGLLLNERWRRMISNPVYSSKLCAIAVDEAHVIKQW